MVWAWVIGSLCGILATLNPHGTAYQNTMVSLAAPSTPWRILIESDLPADTRALLATQCPLPMPATDARYAPHFVYCRALILS